MNIERDVDYLKNHLSLHLHNLLPPEYCADVIARYNDAKANGRLDAAKEELIDECRGQVFTDELNALLDSYFQGPFKLCWPTFDVVGCAGATQNLNTLWHLDNGVPGTHKLFIYLNPVAEHGGNTVMVDLARTDKLKKVGALPFEEDGRKEDLTEVFEQLGVSPEVHAYDLKAGDGILFDPLTLAHRCQPTTTGRRRYTICYTLVPGRGFRKSAACP